MPFVLYDDYGNRCGHVYSVTYPFTSLLRGPKYTSLCINIMCSVVLVTFGSSTTHHVLILSFLVVGKESVESICEHGSE